MHWQIKGSIWLVLWGQGSAFIYSTIRFEYSSPLKINAAWWTKDDNFRSVFKTYFCVDIARRVEWSDTVFFRCFSSVWYLAVKALIRPYKLHDNPLLCAGTAGGVARRSNVWTAFSGLLRSCEVKLLTFQVSSYCCLPLHYSADWALPAGRLHRTTDCRPWFHNICATKWWRIMTRERHCHNHAIILCLGYQPSGNTRH